MTFFPGMLRNRTRQLGLIVASFLMCGLTAQAQEREIRVARISLIEGEVSYQRANDSRKDWFDATLNLPLDESDQLYSGPNGRAEVQLSGRNLIRLSRDTNLRFTQFNTTTAQMALPVGTATFRIESLDKRQFHIVDANDPGINEPVYFEVDTPTVAITFVKEGDYRVNVRDDGTTEVIVRRGQAEVYNQEIGAIVVKKGRRAVIEGRDNFYQISRLEEKDSWDKWNDRRDDDLFSRVDSYRSTRYVPASIPGVYDLDRYGDWVETPDYGWVWAPRGVATGWAPYRAGYWRWYPSYGWTWISYEPWGWAPYHYGRWAYWGNRWCWVPRVDVSLGWGWGWRPHLVTFFGWGGGRYNRGYRDGFNDGYRSGYRDARWDYLGWCPLGPRDRYYGPGSTAAGNDANARRIETLNNYSAPGGVSSMDARKFDNGRALVTAEELRAPAPARGAARGSKEQTLQPTLVRNIEELKPTQAMPSRNTLIERGDVARRIEAPVIARRAVDPARSLDGAARPTRDGQLASPAPERKPQAGGERIETGAAPSRGAAGQTDRPSRAPEYRPAERTTAPVWRAPGDGRTTTERGDTPRTIERSPAPTRIERPSRSEMPSRVERTPERTNEEAPRRAEPPARPQQERREMPRPERRPDPPPTRESMPSRSERPSPPPPSRDSAPARESAPSRAPERPASPPKESAPARPERSERPMPSRKPEP